MEYIASPISHQFVLPEMDLMSDRKIVSKVRHNQGDQLRKLNPQEEEQTMYHDVFYLLRDNPGVCASRKGVEQQTAIAQTEHVPKKRKIETAFIENEMFTSEDKYEFSTISAEANKQQIKRNPKKQVSVRNKNPKKPSSKQTDKIHNKKKRQLDLSKGKHKWSHEEVHTLLLGMVKHGNRWVEIQRTLTNRSYSQTKDKGRRMLSTHEWFTGKKRKEGISPRQQAKEISIRILPELEVSANCRHCRSLPNYDLLL